MPPTSHAPVTELQATFDAAKAQTSVSRQAELCRSVLAACPLYVPAMLLEARAQLLGAGEAQGGEGAPLANVETTLKAALDASDRAVEPLLEAAHFLYTARSAHKEADALFSEAIGKLLALLEDALATRIEVLAESERYQEARGAAALATRCFPHSIRVGDAVALLKASE